MLHLNSWSCLSGIFLFLLIGLTHSKAFEWPFSQLSEHTIARPELSMSSKAVPKDWTLARSSLQVSHDALDVRKRATDADAEAWVDYTEPGMFFIPFSPAWTMAIVLTDMSDHEP